MQFRYVERMHAACPGTAIMAVVQDAGSTMTDMMTVGARLDQQHTITHDCLKAVIKEFIDDVNGVRADLMGVIASARNKKMPITFHAFLTWYKDPALHRGACLTDDLVQHLVNQWQQFHEQLSVAAAFRNCGVQPSSALTSANGSQDASATAAASGYLALSGVATTVPDAAKLQRGSFVPGDPRIFKSIGIRKVCGEEGLESA